MKVEEEQLPANCLIESHGYPAYAITPAGQIHNPSHRYPLRIVQQTASNGRPKTTSKTSCPKENEKKRPPQNFKAKISKQKKKQTHKQTAAEATGVVRTNRLASEWPLHNWNDAVLGLPPSTPPSVLNCLLLLSSPHCPALTLTEERAHNSAAKRATEGPSFCTGRQQC